MIIWEAFYYPILSLDNPKIYNSVGLVYMVLYNFIILNLIISWFIFLYKKLLWKKF